MNLNDKQNELTELEIDEASKALEEELKKSFPHIFEEEYDISKYKQYAAHFSERWSNFKKEDIKGEKK